MATWCLAKECSISVNVKMVTATAFFKEKSINFLVGFMFPTTSCFKGAGNNFSFIESQTVDSSIRQIDRFKNFSRL